MILKDTKWRQLQKYLNLVTFCHQLLFSADFSFQTANVNPGEHGLVHVHHGNTNTLTDVSGQWRVRPWQGGRGAGEDEAFPVTGPAARTHKQQQVDTCLHHIGTRQGATLSLMTTLRLV